MTGFPTGQFRIVNVETGLCMYMRPIEGSNGSSPIPSTRVSQGKADELWRFDGRIINTAEVRHLGTFALRVLDGGIHFTGTGSTLGNKWEHKEGIISPTGWSDVLTCKGEGTWTLDLAPANGTQDPPIRAAIKRLARSDDLDAWLDAAPDDVLRRLLDDLRRVRTVSSDFIYALKEAAPAVQRHHLKQMLASEPPLPTLNQEWRFETA
ncbi:hypothetical protein ACWCOW_31920 [Streptomyces sp. NPDC001939]